MMNIVNLKRVSTSIRTSAMNRNVKVPFIKSTLILIIAFQGFAVNAAEKEDTSQSAVFTYSEARQISTEEPQTDADTKLRLDTFLQQAKTHQQAQSSTATAAESVTREHKILTVQNQKIYGDKRFQKSRANQSAYYDFGIYDVSSRLFEDFDRDGFYQTFSVTFDADVISNVSNVRANVYAEMYFSRNNGPWEHYYTTKVFSIVGGSTQDDFEVLTTLYKNYRTDHYDVLIDLYEVGYSDVVATVSSDDVDALYALPLESSDRDTYYETEVHGGSMSWLFIVGLAFIAIYRRTVEYKVSSKR